MNESENPEKDTETKPSGPVKPSLSGAAIAGAMLCGGIALVLRGGVYLTGYILREKAWIKQ